MFWLSGEDPAHVFGAAEPAPSSKIEFLGDVFGRGFRGEPAPVLVVSWTVSVFLDEHHRDPIDDPVAPVKPRIVKGLWSAK